VMGYITRTLKLCNIWGGTGHIGGDIYSSKFGTYIGLINVHGQFKNQGAYLMQLLSCNLL